MKPDWAERIQRSRKREYDKGWADCEARIIKLLPDFFRKLPEGDIAKNLTALIKGEQE